MSDRVPQTYIQTEGGVTNLGSMIEEIADLDNAEFLSDWENDFAADMLDQFQIRRGATNHLSKNQIASIERIYRKLQDRET